MRLPHLSATAKGQLWGLLVGGSLAVLLVDRIGLSWGLFFVGWGAAWVLGEKLFGARLIGHSDMKAVALAVATGLAFPWVGVAFAVLFQLMRP
jgi:hypothetical protein